MKIPALSFLIAGVAFFQAHLPAETSQLWPNGGNDWDPATSRLKDFTNVGYMNGDVSIPDENAWPVGVDVTQAPYNAIPDDDIDDSQAFIDAIAACPANQAVFVPKGKYIIKQRISIDRDYVVLRGEDMYETILFYPKYINELYVEEAGYENPAYFSQGNGYRNTGGEWLILMPGGTHRSIENLSIEFREQTKMGHWEHKGANVIRNSSTDSWIRNIYIKNADHGISTSNGQFITVQKIVMDQFIDRNKIAIEQEGSRVGHMAMHLNNTDENLFHNILFTGAWSHGFDTKQTHGCVISHIKSPRGAAAYHGQGVRDNLYTDFEVNYYAGSPNSNNPDNETFWGIYSPDGNMGMDPVHTDDTLEAYNLESDGHVFVGYNVDSLSLPTKSNPNFWYENIDAQQLDPINIYLAQMAKVGKPVPATPALHVPNPYSGDVIRIKAVENSTVSAGTPDTPNFETLQLKLDIKEAPYIKFDLSSIDPADLTSIHRVRLRLASEQIQSTPVELGVFSVTDDSWAEETLTYNNRPAPVNLLDSHQVSEDSQALVMEYDVTAYVQDQWANDPSKKVSFNVSVLSGDGFLSSLTSLTNGFGPILIIEQVADPVADAPTAPTEVRATSLIGNVQLDWPDNPESDVVSYNVYRSYVSGDLTQYSFPIGMGLTTSDFIDIQDKHDHGWDVGMLRDDIPYFYRVTAVDKHGYESESSLEVIASAKSYLDNSQPPSFTLDPVILSKATQYLPYSGSLAGSAIDPEGDTVYYAKLDGPDWLQIAPDGSITATPRAGDTGTYQFTVVASALYGGNDEATVILAVDPAAPDAPQLGDVIQGDSSIQLGWSHDAEGTANFTFNVYRATVAGGPFNQIANGLTQSDLLDSGLSNGTTYYYLITANNISGESPVSAVTSATPIAGFSVGTTYLGGGLITDPTSWDNGLPIGQWGRININAPVDTSISLDGYSILHTGGSIEPTGISGLKLINGSQWITEGDTATTETSFRGFDVSSGSSFTLNNGTINTNNGRDWSLSDTGSAITVNGGTLNLGRSLKISGSAGPIFTLNGGIVNGNPSSGSIGGNTISDNAKTQNFDGGTMTVKELELRGDNTVINLGGTSAGSLSAETILGFGANSAINFLPGSLTSISISSPSNWAETEWNAGHLTYNGQGTATLGSWAAVTAQDGLEPGVRFDFDSGTGTLSLTQAVEPNQPPTFSVGPIERSDALETAAYIGSIAGDASDPDSDPLTFSRLSGPAWLSVAPNGDLSGTPSRSDTGLNSFQVQVSDGKGGSDSAILEITVTNINDAPVFLNDPIAGAAATEDTAYTGTLYGSASDQDGDTLSYTVTAGPAWLNVASLGNLSGTPTNSDVGLNSFTIEVSDGNGGSDTATLEITVANANDAPVFGSDPITGTAATEEVAYSGTLSGSASDDDGDNLSYSKTGGPAWLSVAPNGALSGTPANEDVGLNTFTIHVSDGNGGSDSATLEITVVNVNDAPVFSTDPIVGSDATENAFYSSTLAGSASDVDASDVLSYSKTSGPAWLSVGSDGDLYGTPDSNDLGLNSFTVSVSDGHGGSDSTVLEITVNAGSAPTAFTDADVNDSLISNPGNWSNGLPTGGVLGTIAINAKHDSGFTHDGYHVIHTDGVISKTGFSSLKLGTGTVWEMNGATAQLSSTRGMTLTGALFIMNEGTADLTENSSDSSLNVGSELIVNGGNVDVGRSLLLNGGDLTVTGGTLSISTDMGSRNFHGGGNANLDGGSVTADMLTYGQNTFQVNLGGNTAGTFIISNFGGNRADLNHIDINFEPGTQVTMQLTNPVESGVSGDGDLGWSAIGSETGLPWAEALWSDGRLTYNGQDYSTLGSWATATSTGLGDGYAFIYDNGTNTLSLVALNQPPVFSADPVLESDATEDAPYSATLSDDASDANQGDTLTFSKTSGPAWLSVASNGDLSGIPANSDVGLNSFTVQVDDGNGGTDSSTLEITVVNVNDAPVFSIDPVAGTDATEDFTYSESIAGSASDIDIGDSLSYSKTGGPVWLTVASNGDLSGTPGNGDVGLNSFTVEVSDGNGGTDNATLEISVINTNDAPVFSANPIAGSNATEDAAYAGSITGTAIDIDVGDSLSYSKTGGPAWLAVASNGSLSGTPGNGDVGLNSFTVEVSDGSGGTDSATLEISVINMNDAPVFSANPIAGSNATEDAAYAGSITGTAIDIDVGDSLSYSKTGGPAWLAVASNGSLSGTPGNGDVGLNSFTVEVSDGNGGTDSATLEITVINTNDDPAFASDPIAGANATEDAAYSGSIAGTASDVDVGDSLSYSKTGGPAWLTVASNGDLSGTPISSDLGLNSFTVEVSDGNGGTDSATLEITVSIPGTDFLGGDIATLSNWTNGLPSSSANPGTVTVTGTIPPATTVNYFITQTAGTISNSNFQATQLDGGEWNLDGGTFTARGLQLLAGSTAFNVSGSGVADLGNNNSDVVVNSGTSFTVSGGTVTLGRDLEVSGGVFTISGGIITGDIDTRIGSYGFQANGVFNFNGGTTTAFELNLQGSNVQINFGGTTSGSLTVDSILGTSGTIDWAPGSLMSLTVSSSSTWAETEWNSGRLTYNGEGTSTLGTWATVTSTGFGDGYAFSYDSGTNTLSIAIVDTTPPAAPVLPAATVGIGSVDLDWPDSSESDFASYSVYRSESQGGPYTSFATGLTVSNHTDGSVVANTIYYYVVKALDDSSNESGYSNEVSAQPGLVTEVPQSETLVNGTVSGLIINVSSSDDTYQTITEINNGTTSILEHIWVFDVTGAEVVTFYVEAHHTANAEGDDFIFSYSLDDVNYTEMLTVTKTADDNSAQYYTLPSGLSGTVYVRVHDADASAGNTQLDSIYIDELVIESEVSSLAPTAAADPAAADGATDVGTDEDLSWTAGLYAASHDVYFGTNPTPTFQGNQAGTTYDPGTLLNDTTYYWSVSEVNSTGTTAGPVWFFTTVPSGPQLASMEVSNVGDTWQAVTLPNTYISPVVVATVVLNSTSDAPAVTRVRNVTANSLELKVQNPSGGALSGYTVHLVVVEEGVYTVAEHGVNLEALKILSTGITRKSSWSSSNMEQIIPSNSYTSPVVLGQVMTDADGKWSSFWSSNGTQQNPASSTAIYVGKHIGEDTDTVRSDETLGVVILESGSGSLDGVNFAAGVGSDIARGIGNSPPFAYSLSGLSTVSHAALSSAAMDGSDGGWPVLFGSTPVSATNLDLAIDEDQIGDSERAHTHEQVSYLVLE